jgi:hypothetical protein
MKTNKQLPAFLLALAASSVALASTSQKAMPYVPSTACPAGQVPGTIEKKCVPNVDPQRLVLQSAKRGGASPSLSKGVPTVSTSVISR